MNRQIIYPGQIPLDTDLLQVQKNIQQTFGYVMQAAFGSNTICDGLVIAPTSPATMAVNIGSGSIIAMETTDQTNFGSLAIDNNYIMKMGINPAATSLTLATPTVAGNSINYLIEACFSENDGTPVLLPYFNAANPSMVFSGPSNSGSPNNTQRIDSVSIRYKAGNQAVTGQQNSPVVDAGYVPLGIVTVAFGQTSITAANITNFLVTRVGTKLSQLQTKLTSNLNLYVSSVNGSSFQSGTSWNDPFDTPQTAWNAIINNYNLNGYSVTINIAAGTYPAVNCAGQPQGYGAYSTILLTGAGATTILNSTGLQSAVSASNGANVQISNILVEGTTGISAQTGSQAFIVGGVTFANCSTAHMTAASGFVTILGNYNITGGSPIHFQTAANGFIATFNSPVVTGTGAQAFSSSGSAGFATAVTGLINLTGITFSGCGAFTGARYYASGGGYINTQTNNTSFLPGNASGTVNTGTTYSGYYS